MQSSAPSHAAAAAGESSDRPTIDAEPVSQVSSARFSQTRCAAPLSRAAVQRTLVVLASLAMVLQVAWQQRLSVSIPENSGDRGKGIVFQIDLDHADPHELSLLPGIGPVLARRIVADRETRGPFRNLAELDRVPGIGPKRLEEIRRWTKSPRFDRPPRAARPNPGN